MKSEKEIREKIKHIEDLENNKDYQNGFFRLENEQRSYWIDALKWALKKTGGQTKK